jgi:hypothetical protein
MINKKGAAVVIPPISLVSISVCAFALKTNEKQTKRHNTIFLIWESFFDDFTNIYFLLKYY